MVLPDSDRVSRVPPYSGISCVTFDLKYRTFTLYGLTFQTILLSNRESRLLTLQPRISENIRFRLFPVRSPLLRESFLLSFPEDT